MRHMLHEILFTKLRNVPDDQKADVFVIGIQIISLKIHVMVMHYVDRLYRIRMVDSFQHPEDHQDKLNIKNYLLGFARIRELVTIAMRAVSEGESRQKKAAYKSLFNIK